MDNQTGNKQENISRNIINHQILPIHAGLVGRFAAVLASFAHYGGSRHDWPSR